MSTTSPVKAIIIILKGVIISLIEQNKIPQVAMEFMNHVHVEDIDIINDLYNLILSYSSDPSTQKATAIDQQYEKWYEHTLDHFHGEETKMLELNFPPYAMHKGEHDKALMLMESMYRAWKEDRDITQLKRYIAEEIPAWLHNHIQTMDTITAMFFSQQMQSRSV